MTGDGWRPTQAHARSVIAASLLGMVGVLARRPDLLVLATPFTVAAVWGAFTRPRCAPVVAQRLGHHELREGEATTWHVDVHDVEGRVDDLAVVLEAPPWCDREPESGQRAISARDDGSAGLDVVIRSTRWGRRIVGPALVVATSCWGAYRWATRPGTEARTLLTLPQPSVFDAAAPPVRTPGLIGINRSPRPGSGAEFAGIRAFQPGDRLRRIHWRSTLRSTGVQVTSTWDDHDRQVVLLIDAIQEIGPSGGIDGRASSVDIALRAAGAIAEHHVVAGDRIAVVVLGARGVLRVPSGSGRRHLRRVLEVLATTDPAAGLADDGRLPRGLGGDARIVVLSPLVSPRMLQRAVTLAAAGRAVVVVDCFPADLTDDDPDDPHAALAWRIERLERAGEIRRAAERGVAVVPWKGPGSLDLVLRNLHRAPRSSVGGER